MRISDTHLVAWRRHGYTIVDGFLTEPTLAVCQTGVHALFPGWDTYASAPLMYCTEPDGACARELPHLGDMLNQVALDPALIDFAERALGTPDILLTESKLCAAYTGFDAADERLHADFMERSILVPSEDERAGQLTATVYYQDASEDLGPTYVVPRNGSEPEPLVPYLRPRQQYGDLYARERPVMVPAGGLFLCDLRTFHRGSRMARAQGMRATHHIAFRRADTPWVTGGSWASGRVSQDFRTLLEHLSPRQRQVLGFPPPGHPYWTTETLAANAARYPGMDLTPYLVAAHVDASVVERERERLRHVPPPHATMDSTGAVSAMGCLREGVRVLLDHGTRVAACCAGSTVTPTAPLLLNLGCGDAVLPGFVNVDVMAGPGVQVADLRQPWPWADSSVDYAYASHVIEHLPDKILTMNELWRVLKRDAFALIHVPTTEGPGAWQDPTHVSFWNQRSFLYFEAGSPYREGFADRYGIRARLRIVWRQVIPTIDGPQLSILLQAVKS